MSTYITKYAKEKGLRKEDAKTNLLVTLNQSDITKAKMKDSKNCAFACAVKRQMPNVEKAYFFRSTAWLEMATKIVRYHLPQSVQKEIVSFDRSGMSEVGIYSLTAPRGSNTMDRQNTRSKKRIGRHKPGKTGRSQKLIHRTTNIRTLEEPEE